MNLSIFHSDNPKEFHKKNSEIKIWTPDTRDINFIARDVIEHWNQSRIKIEHTNNLYQEAIDNISESKIKLIDTSQQIQPIKKIRKVWLYAQSDTLAHSLYNISIQLKGFQYCFVLPVIKKENADIFLKNKGIDFKTFSYNLFIKEKPDIVLLLNDWSKEAKRLISICRLFKVPSICIQESIIDFGDKYKRMEHADYVFIQGTQTSFELNRNQYFITGNPRYETIKKVKRGNKKTAVINCNFTYNINENIRQDWLDDIIDTLDEENLDYFISQHPRDRGDLSKYENVFKSNSASIHQLVERASILITRFSSLIHEALIMGVPVIYYNPHKEKMKYDFNFNNEFLFEAVNKTELNHALKKIKEGVDFKERDAYLSKHCILPNSIPSKTIYKLLCSFDFLSASPKLNNYFRIFIYHPYILRLVLRIRSILRVFD